MGIWCCGAASYHEPATDGDAHRWLRIAVLHVVCEVVGAYLLNQWGFGEACHGLTFWAVLYWHQSLGSVARRSGAGPGLRYSGRSRAWSAQVQRIPQAVNNMP